MMLTLTGSLLGVANGSLTTTWTMGVTDWSHWRALELKGTGMSLGASGGPMEVTGESLGRRGLKGKSRSMLTGSHWGGGLRVGRILRHGSHVDRRQETMSG